MAKKIKTPPMTEARKAIFARFNCEDQAKTLHEQLTKGYEKLKAGWPNLPYTDDVEANGNLLLVACFEAQQEREQRQIARYQMGRKQASAFHRIFGRQLCNYFDHVIGFNVCKFDADVVKSPEGESCREAIQRQWGDEGLAIIEALMR
ncbi:MAG: hypothetical protein M0R80_28740 [Proteobacteria bacterium]|jgi:hypothetical protein|nr:hypothetical protein [Pseudomonadota bacterium]